MRENIKESFKLLNGKEIPSIGFGTSLIVGEECVNNIKQALEVGYTHIDTAAAYKNEEFIGKAIRKSGIPRDKIFITSKVWKDSMGYEKTVNSFNNTLKSLGLAYIDLFLIHWPSNKSKELNLETWKALEDLYKAGKVKSIGVSNFLEKHLEIILEKCEITPMVNQLEYHPGLTRKETVDFCKEHNIVVEAWAPLGKGKMLQNKDLIRMANKYNKSTAQICIRWCLQNEIIPLPKSSNINRMRQNREVFDFEISEEDMDFINNMEFFAGSDMDPMTFN